MAHRTGDMKKKKDNDKIKKSRSKRRAPVVYVAKLSIRDVHYSEFYIGYL